MLYEINVKNSGLMETDSMCDFRFFNHIILGVKRKLLRGKEPP